MRLRILLLALCLAAPAGAGRREAEVLLAQAMRRQANPPANVPLEQVVDEAYQTMAEALRADPSFWGVHMEMGLNRCRKAEISRELLAQHLEMMRAQGRSPSEIEVVEAKALDFIDQVVMLAYRHFVEMRKIMKRTGTQDRDLLQFAEAMLKSANGEYLEAKRGEPGAIDDLKTLIKRTWNPERCAELIARMYMRLGADAFRAEQFTEAQQFWDKGLNFVVSDSLRGDLLTNKANAHATRNEYTLAEEVLRGLLRKNPEHPAHWKNLGLVLGYQNLLDPALYAYRHARRISRELGRGDEIARRHGNAWLKAAMIHGKLREADGDLDTAWRLFLEYRAMFGDDYNFCFNFGEFCFHMEQYELSWRYLRRAAEIHPFCPNPWLLLVRVAQRLSTGTPEEQKERRENVKKELDEARKRFAPSQNSHAVKRVCGGLQEPEGEELNRGPAPRLDPDPLAGLAPDAPPAWVRAKAEEREPHERFDPPVAGFLGMAEEPETLEVEPVEEPADAERRPLAWIVAAAVLALGGAVFLVRRLRAA